MLALTQSSLRQMLAYLSVAQGGLVSITLVGLEVEQSPSFQRILFFLLCYCLASFLIFSCIVCLEKRTVSNLHLTDIVGLGKRDPFLSIAFSFGVLSYAGIPLTTGFWSKILLLLSTISYGSSLSGFLIIAGGCFLFFAL